MTTIQFVHLIAIGIWVGCVATEIVCELSQKNVNFKQSFIAPLHWRIDKYVEIPAILLTFITGSLMFEAAVWTPLFKIKITAGIAAVILNSVAAFTVYMRYTYFSENDERGYAKYHLLHERVGIACTLAIITALLSGGLNHVD